VADRKVLWSVNSLGSPKGVTITPDNSMAFVTLNGDRSVAAIDLATRQVLGKVGVGGVAGRGWIYGPSIK
jgi:YVTN family beta-propeller protein